MTGDGLVTHGTADARQAMIKIYDANLENLQTIMQNNSLEAAIGPNFQPNGNHMAETLRISKPPKLQRPLSLLNERQLLRTAIDLMNRKRLANGDQTNRRQKIDWGMEDGKPEEHPEGLVAWEDIVQSPARMSNSEFQQLAKVDKEKFPNAPHKPTKTDYFRELIKNILRSLDIEDPENYYDREVFSSKVQKNITKGNRHDLHRLPPPPRVRPDRQSTPIPREVRNQIHEEVELEISRSPNPTPPRPLFSEADPTEPTDPPEAPSFVSERSVTEEVERDFVRRSMRTTKGIPKPRSIGGNAAVAICHFCKKSFFVVHTVWARCDHGLEVHWECYKSNPTCGL